MDILEKYEKENPQASSQAPSWEPSEEYSGITRFVVRFSGGRIRDIHQVNYVLLVISVLLIIFSFIIFFTSGGKRQSLSPNDFLLTPPPPSAQ